MTLPLCYASATALHDAIKVRVAAVAEHGRYDINQLRRHFAYDRFLTRLFLDPNSTWVLKGGTGLLARVPQHARHTQDINFHYRRLPDLPRRRPPHRQARRHDEHVRR